MSTMEVINKAVAMINEHDFFWVYASCESVARIQAQSHMSFFVKLINTIDANTREALRDLWMARYEWAKKNMFEIDREALRTYKMKEAKTLAFLTTLTSSSIAA